MATSSVHAELLHQLAGCANPKIIVQYRLTTKGCFWRGEDLRRNLGKGPAYHILRANQEVEEVQLTLQQRTPRTC